MARTLVGYLSNPRMLIYAVLALGLLLWLRQPSSGSLEGVAAPDLVLPDVQGDGEQSLQPREKPLLIEVFASWCSTCRRNLPTLARAYQEHSAKVDFIGVSVDDHPEAAARAKEGWPIPYPVAHDANRAFSRAYAISVLPTFVLIGRDGRIKKVHHGSASNRRLEDWIETLTH